MASKLEIPSRKIDNSFVKHCKTYKNAIYDIIAQWRMQQKSREEAYVKMGKALTHADVGLKLKAREVLEYPNTVKKSKGNPAKQGIYTSYMNS